MANPAAEDGMLTPSPDEDAAVTRVAPVVAQGAAEGAVEGSADLPGTSEAQTADSKCDSKRHCRQDAKPGTWRGSWRDAYFLNEYWQQLPWHVYVSKTLKLHLLLLFMLGVCPGLILISIGLAGASDGQPHFMIGVTLVYLPVILLAVACDYMAIRKLKNRWGQAAMALVLGLDMTMYIMVASFLVPLTRLLF